MGLRAGVLLALSRDGTVPSLLCFSPFDTVYILLVYLAYCLVPSSKM